MKLIKLPHGKFAIVDDENFEYLNQFSWRVVNGYVITGKKGLSMHRLLMNLPDTKEVDHKNLNKLDNRKFNLRLATESQNKANREVQSNNRHGNKGLTFESNKWRARIQVDKRRIHLGVFNTLLEAKSVYAIASRKYFGDFSRTNT